MLYLSRKDLEQIGARVYKAYKNLPDLKDNAIYSVDPEKLIKDLLKLKLEYHHLSLDGIVLGVTTPYRGLGYKIFDVADNEDYFMFDGNTILVESDLKNDITQIGRRNFTLAHEAGHQILKMMFPQDYNSEAKLSFCRSQPEKMTAIRDWCEWQANTLGSIILMPREIVEGAMFLFGLGKQIKMLNRVFSSEEYTKFSNMANFLGVSKKALAIRLKQLGYVDKYYFDEPYSVLDVYCDMEAT